MVRTATFLLLFILLPGCGSGDDPVLVNAEGNAFNFGPEGGRVGGADVFVLERPELSVVTGEKGEFEITGLVAGEDATFVMEHPDFAPIQTGTFLPDELGLQQVTFQAPDHAMFGLMAVLANIEPDPQRCQIASTVTRLGGTLYGAGAHGEAGATVTIDPPVPSRHGPCYFNLAENNIIYPDWELTETTDDGGVLYVNVEPGDYLLTAHKDGVKFTTARMKCRAGMLVNASPPKALQVVD
jgi:hypothetical protein